MGYSVSVHFTSSKNKDKMEMFLQKHFKGISEILIQLPRYGKIIKNANKNQGFIPKRCLDYPPHSELGYDDAKYKLGYNYSALENFESYYWYQILSWVSLKLGKKYKYGERKLNAIIYDGKQKIPIYLSEEDCLADKSQGKKEISSENGYCKMVTLMDYQLEQDQNQILSKFELEMQEDAKKMSELVEEELSRLDEAWKQYGKRQSKSLK